MTTYVPAKVNTEYIFYMGLVSQSTGQFQTNPTLAAGDVKVSKDGGALNNLTTLPAVTPASSKMVKVTVSATEMNAANITLVFSDAAGAEWDDCIVNIQTVANQLDDLSARIPAALSANGNIKADIKEIEDNLTSGNNATLNLKQLNIINNAGTALFAWSTGGNGHGMHVLGNGAGQGMKIEGGESNSAAVWINGVSGYPALMITNTSAGGGSGIYIEGMTSGVEIYNDEAGDAIHAESLIDGHGINIIGAGTGASIHAPQGIIGSDSLDLNVTNIRAGLAYDSDVQDVLTQTDQLTFDSDSQVYANAAVSLSSDDIDTIANTVAASIDVWGTALPGPYTAGEAGYIVGTNLNATISSRLADSDYVDPDNAGIATIQAQTDKLGFDSDNYVYSHPMTAITATPDSDTADEIAAIKAKTDQLTFTNPGEVDANVQSVNDTEVTGNGSSQPWGPA